MDQHQYNPRSAAARAFMESLNHLQETFQPAADSQSVPPVPPTGSKSRPTELASSEQFDLSSFEQAVADIEQFMQKREEDERGKRQ